MKIQQLFVKAVLMFSLMGTTAILAEDKTDLLSDNTNNINSEEECGIDLLPPQYRP